MYFSIIVQFQYNLFNVLFLLTSVRLPQLHSVSRERVRIGTSAAICARTDELAPPDPCFIPFLLSVMQWLSATMSLYQGALVSIPVIVNFALYGSCNGFCGILLTLLLLTYFVAIGAGNPEMLYFVSYFQALYNKINLKL